MRQRRMKYRILKINPTPNLLEISCRGTNPRTRLEKLGKAHNDLVIENPHLEKTGETWKGPQ
jgi:hypothetical protein